MMRRSFSILSFVATLLGSVAVHAAPPDEANVKALLFPNPDADAIKRLGPEVLPALARIYEGSSEEERATVASLVHTLGWQSPDAKRALMQNLQASNPNLRLQVQWALGRLSGDRDVVDVLLADMRNDGNPLFRDKAAFVLAHERIPLSDEQKVQLCERMIRALSDPKLEVRSVAIQALQIQTGQTKGYQPTARPRDRERPIRAWEAWLAEYRSQR